MNWKELAALDEQYMMQTCKRHPVDIDHGQGATLYDLQGREYIDFAAGMGTNTLGYGHESWAEAIMDQTLKLGNTSHLFYTQPCILLAEQLCRRSGMANACFTSSGSEANALMKQLARKYSFDRYGSGRSTILMLQEFPSSEEIGLRFVRADMDEIQEHASNDVCAVMLELLQKDGGMTPLSRQFVHALAIFCAEHNWLLLINEEQTGAGRTGPLFAFQEYGILPDVISFASGVSGGLPLGGILANNRCRNVLTIEQQTTSLGGNPISAAAALAVLDILNEHTLAQVKEKGDYLRSGISALNLPILGEPYGAGLMVGVTLSGTHDHFATASMLSGCGLLCHASKSGLLFLPPLLITKEEMDRGLSILKQALGEGD